MKGSSCRAIKNSNQIEPPSYGCEICLRPKVPGVLGKSSESGITAVRACQIAIEMKQSDNDKKTTALSL